jgi:L-cysteine:1D-myo-inositol 2-amino-2-deoxy-alpha-D-glucopyranoside ligase
MPAAPGATPVLSAVRAHLANDLDAPSALATIDRWAENARLRSGASGAEDSFAGSEIKAIASSLLGVQI